MPNAQNVETMAFLKEELTGVSAVWAVNYSGLTVKKSQELRRSLREANAEMHVFKNTLMRKALAACALPSMDEILEGPSAFIFAKGEPNAAAKVIKDFAKANPAITLKGGIMDGSFLDADQAMAVASLPSREELLAKVLATMLNPLSSFARVVNAYAEKKAEGDGEAA